MTEFLRDMLLCLSSRFTASLRTLSLKTTQSLIKMSLENVRCDSTDASVASEVSGPEAALQLKIWVWFYKFVYLSYSKNEASSLISIM